MGNKDFRAGDKVTCLHCGTGVVECVCGNATHPVMVRFDCGDVRTYTMGGFGLTQHKDSPPFQRRWLYHGHNVTFTAEGEEIPKRTVKVTRYVNIRHSETGELYIGGIYESLEKAKDCVVPTLNSPTVAIGCPVKMELSEEEA